MTGEAPTPLEFITASSHPSVMYLNRKCLNSAVLTIKMKLYRNKCSVKQKNGQIDFLSLLLVFHLSWCRTCLLVAGAYQNYIYSVIGLFLKRKLQNLAGVMGAWISLLNLLPWWPSLWKGSRKRHIFKGKIAKIEILDENSSISCHVK